MKFAASILPVAEMLPALIRPDVDTLPAVALPDTDTDVRVPTELIFGCSAV